MPLKAAPNGLGALTGGIAGGWDRWKTVYHYFRIWRLTNVWEDLNTALRETIRVQAGRNPQPSAASMDTQVSTTTMVGGLRGYNGYKRVNG